MCIYYTIHSLTKKADGEKDGAKNARTFFTLICTSCQYLCRCCT